MIGGMTSFVDVMEVEEWKKLGDRSGIHRMIQITHYDYLFICSETIGDELMLMRKEERAWTFIVVFHIE